MAENYSAQRIDSNEIRNLPLPRQHHCASNHEASAEKAEQEGEFEAFDKARKFFKEGGVFNFLCSGSPRHIDFEEMA